jgi:hypothetical protein
MVGVGPQHQRKKNLKSCAKKWTCPILNYYPRIWLTEWSKTMTDGLQAEIHFRDSPHLTNNINH